MKKIELKYLAPYLPYKLRLMHGGIEGENKVMNMGQGSSTHWVGINSVLKWQEHDKLKALPILRPFSDLTKKCVINNREFIPLADVFCIHPTASFRFTNHKDTVLNCWDGVSDEYEVHGFYLNPIMGLNKHQDVQKLFEWHFDVFGLISKGLAIDINTLKNQNQDG